MEYALIKPCYSPLYLSGIREYIKGLSVSQSISLLSHPHTFLHDGAMDFLHIRYHDQVPWAADAYKIEFGVPNLSHYGNFFIHVECLL